MPRRRSARDCDGIMGNFYKIPQRLIVRQSIDEQGGRHLTVYDVSTLVLPSSFEYNVRNPAKWLLALCDEGNGGLASVREMSTIYNV
jgi:hypothetical protein